MPTSSTSNSAEPVIEFRNVSYRTENGQHVLTGMNLSVTRGETLVILGRSGSGKTTALKLINRLLEQQEGEVLVEGRSTGEWDPIELRRHIGYVIQEGGLFPHYTVANNVALLLKMENNSKEETRARTDEMLSLVDLEPEQFRDRYPFQLSGGQRQRVGVARALAANPPMLLMDEPFGALDPLSRNELQQQFLKLRERLQKTVVLVTHDVREALLLGSRIAVLESGRLIGPLTREEFKRGEDDTVRSYLDAVQFTDLEGSDGKAR